MLHIKNRHYRINPSAHETSGELLAPVGVLEEVSLEGDAFDDSSEGFSPVVEYDASGFTCKLCVPSMFHGNIIGFRGRMLHQLKTEFGCDVVVPKAASGNSIIMIKSTKKMNVVNTARRINNIYLDARRRSKPTHFVCIPVTQEHIRQKFEEFRDAILSLTATKGIAFEGVEEKLFIDPFKLHLTLFPLLLANENEISLAKSLLSDFFQSEEFPGILGSEPLKLSIEGLEILNDDPTNVRVLYDKVSFFNS